MKLLERLGCEVDFPLEQPGCGQMHLNSGYAREGAALAQRFARVFVGAGEALRERRSLARVARVHVHLPAAGLLEREVDLAAKAFEQPNDRVPGLGEQRVVETGDKK